MAEIAGRASGPPLGGRSLVRPALAVLLALVTLTGCLPPDLLGQGWLFARQPGNESPITVDNRVQWPFGTIEPALVDWNRAAGHELLRAYPPGQGAEANIVFEVQVGICPPPWRDCSKDRRHMWVQVFRGPSREVVHCVIHYDPTIGWTSQQSWTPRVLGHEIGHCLDYGDVQLGNANGYLGVMSYENFYSESWQQAYWWGGDDVAMLMRDGYGR